MIFSSFSVTDDELFPEAALHKEQLVRLSLYRNSISRLSLTAGGHGVRLGEKNCISAEDLRKKGTEVPLTQGDFRSYIQNNVIDTSTAAELLHCTRQNIQDLVRRGRLHPVLTLKNNFLFLRDEILS